MVTITVNGVRREVQAPIETPLLDYGVDSVMLVQLLRPAVARLRSHDYVSAADCP